MYFFRACGWEKETEEVCAESGSRKWRLKQQDEDKNSNLESPEVQVTGFEPKPILVYAMIFKPLLGCSLSKPLLGLPKKETDARPNFLVYHCPSQYHPAVARLLGPTSLMLGSPLSKDGEWKRSGWERRRTTRWWPGEEKQGAVVAGKGGGSYDGGGAKPCTVADEAGRRSQAC
ncbi:hypothetical protein Droror1_Dr00000801 [Drosera rotundifolia]